MQESGEIVGMIKRISDRMRSSADASMKHRGLTFSQCRVLHYLDTNGGHASQKEVEEYLDVAHPTVVGLVSRLEKNGFVTCRMSEDDRRTKIITVTEKANNVREAVEEEHRVSEDNLTRGLTIEDQRELLHMLHILYKNISDPEDSCRC